ncbi:hypothetical protein [Bacteroides xylanisolvens]|nr:hypothetical protein [Bacteroides xylanisolvens]
MSIDINEFQKKITNASPLEIPSLLMQLEQYDCETAEEMLNRINTDFQKEELIDNVVTPVMTSIVDALLMLPMFKGITQKIGLNANRVMIECNSFNYDGLGIYLLPDTYVEKHNQDLINKQWSDENRSTYDRSTYQNTSEMGRYKNEKIKEAGTRKNLTDEYTGENNITAKKSNPDLRRNDQKNLYNAETDHIVPLKQIFNQLQNNMGLSDGDIKRIANSEKNLAVTGRRINNPKREMSNSEFIKQQEVLKSQGKEYIDLTPEQKANMIKMEQNAQKAIENGVNNAVIKNLLGQGQADREIRKEAFNKKENELGRKLTQEERNIIDKELAKDKAYDIHRTNIKSAGKQTLMYTMGSAILFMIKPLFYEMKDSIIYGFKEGVNAESFKRAFSIRFSRVKEYVWSQMTNFGNVCSSIMSTLKTLISTIIEGIIGMFVGIFKQAFRIIKEGIKIMTQSYNVLFGSNAKTSTPAEKGDAILKIFGASAAALCGIWIDSMLEKTPIIPESLRGVISTLLSGLASMLVFYLLDKADIFNVKADRRNARIKELFEERINEIRQATQSMNEAVIEKMRQSTLESRLILDRFSKSMEKSDFTDASYEVLALAKNLNIVLDYNNFSEFKNENNNGTINWNM